MNGAFLKLEKAFRVRVQRELGPGESVLWAGVPDWQAEWQRLVGTGLFGACWTALTGFFALAAVGRVLGLVKIDGAPASPVWAAAFLLLMAPFVAIGGALLHHVWRGLTVGWRRVHIITDRRLFTVELDRSRPLDDRPRSSIQFVRVKIGKNGSGTLSIACAAMHEATGSAARPETLSWPGVPAVGVAQALLDERSPGSIVAPPATAVRSRPMLAALPPEVGRAAMSETAGEAVAWVGQPDAAIAAKFGLLAWLFALPWLYFAIKWEAGAIGLLAHEIVRAKTATPVVWLAVMALWGLPFVGIGTTMLAAPLWAWRRARSTAYMITDRRLVTVTTSGRNGTSVASVEPRRIERVTRSAGFGGRETIRMHLGRTVDSEGDETELAETFWLVAGAERAEALIADLRTGAGPRA